MKNESQELILLKRPDGHVVLSEILIKMFNSKLNLRVTFYEKGITGTNFIKKEFDSGFSIFWPHFHICIEVPLIKLQFAIIIGEGIKLLVSNFRETCKTNLYILKKFDRHSVWLIFFINIFF